MVGVQQNLRVERMSQCQSFGSHCNPCSQSRKISIGITVDSFTKTKPGATKDAGVVDKAVKITPDKGDSTEVKKRTQNATAAREREQTDNANQVNSPWITTQKTPTSEPVLRTKPTPCKPADRGRTKKLPGLNAGQGTYSVQFFANNTSVLQSDGCTLKRFDGITYKRKVRTDGNPEGAEEFTLATAQDVAVSDKNAMVDKMEKTDNKSTETLRMKLWQILGTASSPKSQNPNFQADEVSTDKLKAKEVADQIGDTVIRRRQNSDSIEPDSESPNQPASKLITRSLRRTRASTKMRQNRTKTGPASTSKQKGQKKNIFAFEEGASKKVDSPTKCGSSMIMRKKSQRKSYNIQPRKICFSEKSNADEPQGARCSKELQGRADKAGSLGNQRENFHSYLPEDRVDCFEVRNKMQENDPHESPVPEKMNQRCYSKELLGRGDKADSLGNQRENFRSYLPEDRVDSFEARNKIQEKDPHESPVPEKMNQRCCSKELLGRGDEAISLGNQRDNFHSYLPEDRVDCSEVRNKIQGKDPHESPVPEKMNLRCDVDGPALEETREQQQDCGQPSWKDAIDPPDDLQSPTFAFKTPISMPSPCSTPRTAQIEQDVESPDLAETRFTVGNIRSFRNLGTSEPNCLRSDSEMESPDDTGKPKNSSPGVLSPGEYREDPKHGLADSSSEDEHPESSDDGSPVIRRYDLGDTQTSPRTGATVKPNNMPSLTQRVGKHRGVRVDEYGSPAPSHKGVRIDEYSSPSGPSPSPIGVRVDEYISPSPSLKGIRESGWFNDASELNQEDDLTRAVTLFASALENFRRKMDLATKKKSSEILMTVSEGIHLQLQNAKTQIQTEVGKLTSLSKSKRKCMESRFEEKNEQLNLIYKKFKEDIHHHLNDCRSTVEVLEAHQNELKETVKKQRTSHQKLIVKLEEAVQIQLNNAQRRIAIVQESAKDKMLKLKQVISECLKEDIIS